jgi:hypothetical protein
MTIQSEVIGSKHPPQSTLEAAVARARGGAPIFPCNAATKAPLTPRGFKDATTDEATIRSWWHDQPNAMIGMPTGSRTGIFVVDLDTKSDGPKHFADLCEQHGGQPITRTATTPSGGQHLYFRWPQSRLVRNSASKLGKSIDIRGEGGYVIVPPSRRNDGAAYRWNSSETDVDIANAPNWLLDLIDPLPATSRVSSTIETPGSNCAEAALRSELGRVLSASFGERNDILNRASFVLGQIVAGGALAHDEVSARLFSAARAVGSQGMK